MPVECRKSHEFTNKIAVYPKVGSEEGATVRVFLFERKYVMHLFVTIVKRNHD